MAKRCPVLGILYNVVSLASVPVLIGGMFAQSETTMYVGISMMIPTLVLPGTESFRDYWKKFE